MARVGGRNAAFAWIVGIACAATVAALAFLALPLLPAVTGWVDRTFGSGAPAEATDADGATECADLYPEPLWASLRLAAGSGPAASAEAPVTTATDFVAALAPAVQITCAWSSEAGTISTTLAAVAPDAGALAVSALPGAGFACADASGRVRCTRADGESIETIELGEGRWLSTTETGWHPEAYASRAADRVWAR